jgi:PAS domain S-box-containing protein
MGGRPAGAGYLKLSFLASSPSLQAAPAARVEQRLQLLIDAVQDYAIFVLDPQGRIESWNAGAQELKGYSRDEVLGRHFSLFYPPEVVEAGWPEEELRRARQFGRFEDEGWRLRKDGSRFWANVTITALHEGGELTGFAKITRDLTERRAAEEKLRASEQRLSLLVDNVRDYAIFMLDADGIVRSWNAGAQAMNGYTAEEIVGRPFRVLYPPEEARAGSAEAELEAARATGRVEREGWRMRKDGSLYWVNAVVTAIRDEQGRLLGFAKVTRDMSERRRLEELERSSQRMNEFLAMLAHELRNPLAPIRNAVTIMQLETLTSPVLRNCRDVIDRQLTHVTRLVDDLLDVGRLTTGKIKLRRELLRFSDVVVRSVETVRPLVQARRHELRVEQPEEPVYVNGDSTRLSQVLQNLLVNAARYTPEGGRIELKVRPEDAFFLVTVSDNGRGIEPGQLEHIFELFMQADSAAHTSESGLGIGLTLARSLTEMHGGTLEAASEGLGRGSTFTLRLPRAQTGEASEQETPAERPAPGLKVLVVDDNRDSADSASDILRLLGHEVECAYEGRSALETARRLQPDVVMLDLAMPGLDGFETRRLLQSQPGLEKAYMVAMTGFGNEDDRRRTRAAGFDAHLVKPVELDALISLLNEARGRRGGGAGPAAL